MTEPIQKINTPVLVESRTCFRVSQKAETETRLVKGNNLQSLPQLLFIFLVKSTFGFDCFFSPGFVYTETHTKTCTVSTSFNFSLLVVYFNPFCPKSHIYTYQSACHAALPKNAGSPTASLFNRVLVVRFCCRTKLISQHNDAI